MSASAGRERHLLIVDDDDRIRDLLKAYLSRAGFRVSAASGGAQARKLRPRRALNHMDRAYVRVPRTGYAGPSYDLD